MASPFSDATDALDALEVIAFDEEFDPLAVNDEELNQDEMDDDNPYDIVDYPLIRNMPEGMRREAVFTPARQGSAQQAIMAMVHRNPARRPVLMGIVKLCEGGCPSTEVTAQVNAWQKHNRSVYSPMTLCRMLERAGALELEMPETADEQEDVDAGVAYLEITDSVDPIWHATEAGLEVYDLIMGGDPFRKIVFGEDVKYLEVYESVMDFVAEKPRSREEIENLVDTFDIVKKPRRFGGHFIDMLEQTDAIIWQDRAWNMTELGMRLLPEVKAARG